MADDKAHAIAFGTCHGVSFADHPCSEPASLELGVDRDGCKVDGAHISAEQPDAARHEQRVCNEPVTVFGDK